MTMMHIAHWIPGAPQQRGEVETLRNIILMLINIGHATHTTT